MLHDPDTCDHGLPLGSPDCFFCRRFAPDTRPPMGATIPEHRNPPAEDKRPQFMRRDSSKRGAAAAHAKAHPPAPPRRIPGRAKQPPLPSHKARALEHLKKALAVLNEQASDTSAIYSVRSAIAILEKGGSK